MLSQSWSQMQTKGPWRTCQLHWDYLKMPQSIKQNRCANSFNEIQLDVLSPYKLQDPAKEVWSTTDTSAAREFVRPIIGILTCFVRWHWFVLSKSGWDLSFLPYSVHKIRMSFNFQTLPSNDSDKTIEGLDASQAWQKFRCSGNDQRILCR